MHLCQQCGQQEKEKSYKNGSDFVCKWGRVVGE
jgi:hypothetical protein